MNFRPALLLSDTMRTSSWLPLLVVLLVVVALLLPVELVVLLLKGFCFSPCSLTVAWLLAVQGTAQHTPCMCETAHANQQARHLCAFERRMLGL